MLEKMTWTVSQIMAVNFKVFISVMVATLFATFLCFQDVSATKVMSKQKRLQLAEEAKDMFYHGYDAYMDNAFPADELMPLSCQGRYRGVQPDRGDLDDALGNFSLTLIDSLDMLVVVGDLPEFERGVKLVIDNVEFDRDVAVSVFETNIRVVGGLVSAHILAEYLKGPGYMSWYQGQLLNMALDVGNRLLPAFNSTTGLPHPRVNLRHGIKAGKVKSIGETCTACAGTMILEFAALSRLSGEPVFEEKASQAMDVLWAARHRMSNLVGNVLNIQTGDWVRRDSGVGAGIDSYYEYVAKAYVLLGEDKYLDRWETHYSAVMKWVLGAHGHVFQDVHMHKPQSPSKPFIDALGAFWPGLQVLMGDVKPAIEAHEVLYQIMQRHNFIPEAFTADFQVHWGQYLLRPEFVESTYFLHRATGDPHYLDVGEEVLRSLQKHTRVTCGYATIKDVRTLQKEDRMDSFVLSETFKYLYLLFADESESPINVHDFVFTTEGHLLPLSLARLSNRTVVPLHNEAKDSAVLHHMEAQDTDVESSRSCPSISYLFPEGGVGSGLSEYAASVRLPLANVVADKCPTKKMTHRRLLATEFQSNSPEHLAIIRDMGITFMSLPDGRVQLLHTAANAKSPQHAEEGVVFMQEMIEMSKQQAAANEGSSANNPPKALTFVDPATLKGVSLVAGPAQFGREITDGFKLTEEIVVADPIKSCAAANNGNEFWGKIVLVERGDCMFVEKARVLESQGAKGGIVLDNNPESDSNGGSNMFAMSGDGTDDVSIPMLFLFANDGKTLLKAMAASDSNLKATMEEPRSTSGDGSPRRENGEVSSSSGPPAPAAKEEESIFDITSPVSSFLKKSKKQMEKYLKGVLSSSNQQSDEGHDFGDGDPGNDTGVKKDDPVDFSSIESLLNPDSESVRQQVETYVIKNPRLMTELLSVRFSDLVAVFKDILDQVTFEREENSALEGHEGPETSDSVLSESRVKQHRFATPLEEAYVRLFEILRERGAEGISDLAPKLQVHSTKAATHSNPSSKLGEDAGDSGEDEGYVSDITDKYLKAYGLKSLDELSSSEKDLRAKLRQFDILRDEKRIAALWNLIEDSVAVDMDDDLLSQDDEEDTEESVKDEL